LQAPDQRWETTRLGKNWLLDNTVPLNNVFLTELRDFDGAQELYWHRGLRNEEIAKTSDGWQLDNTVDTVSHYSTTGLLLDSKDRNGNTTTFTYDSQNRLLKIVDSVGAITTFTYDGNGKLARIDDPSGRSASFQMDSQGNLTSVTLPDGTRHSYDYDSAHHITKKTDGLGQAMSFAVNQQGVYSTITYADSTTTGFQAQRPKVLAVADPVPGVNRGNDTDLAAGVSADTPDGLVDSNGNQSKFTLDERGYPLSKTDALKFTTTTIRDFRDRILSKVDARGYTTSFVYDDQGNVLEVRLPTSSSGGGAQLMSMATTLTQTTGTGAIDYQYDSLLNLPTQVTDQRGNSTNFEYDTAGNLTKRTDAQGNATIYTYNSRGQALTRTNALGETTHWSYDLKGNIQSITDPAGNVTTLINDSAGRISSITDPLGHTTTFEYNAANRILSSTTADGATTRFTYDANGNRISVTDPLGAVTHYTYDSMDKLVKITAPDNSETRYVYDGMGNRTQVVDPLNHSTVFSYDVANRLVGVTDPLMQTTRFTLDGNGNRMATTDALGHVTSTDYDAFNRPESTTAPDGGITIFDYDPVGNLLTLTDPLSHVTTWDYDELNRAVKTIDPLNRTRLTSYDSTGRVAAQTNGRGQVLRYTYDAAGRPASLDLAGTDTITWTYDAVWNLLQVVDGDSAVTIDYDSVNRPSTIHQVYGTIGYSYDLAGRRSQLTNSNGSVNYIYDALNRLTGLTDQASRSYGFTYDLAGRLTRQSYPNNTYSVLSYDAVNQLTDKGHNHTNGAPLGDNTYLHDAAGNITGWGSSDNNIRAIAYDLNDRVASVQSTLPTVPAESFSYDTVGNWTPHDSRLHNAANEITEDSGFIYSYDLDGNLVEKASKFDLSDVTTYAWDPLNRLIHVNKGAHVISYRYDGLGRRIAKIVDGVETHYVLDGANVLEERNGTNALTAVNLHAGLDQLLMRQDYAAGAVYWTHTDHLRSVEALTDAGGNVVERYRYTSFGQISVLNADFSPKASNLTLQPFTYTGREWEPEVGLYFYRARFMDPRMGRFVSQDPLGFLAGDSNLRAYCGNNPIGWIDPLGLDSMNLINPNAAPSAIDSNPSETKQFVDRTPLDPRYYTVAAHGNAKEVTDSNGNPISAAKLAELIKKDPAYDPKKPVKLNICKAGGHTGDGSPIYAQQLADELKNTVIAPTENLDRHFIETIPGHLPWQDAPPSQYSETQRVLNNGYWATFK
jgi:RHS repeat-associated protein